MQVAGHDFHKGPWNDLGPFIADVDKWYTENVTSKGLGDRFTLAAEKIMKARRWEPSRKLFEANLEPILRDLGIFYVPKHLDPGPGIVFPIYDLNGKPVLGKFWPMYDMIIRDQKAKYVFMGRKGLYEGPVWMGVSDQTIEAMIRTKSVALVEGPYDMLAGRVLCPDIPVLTTGTKTYNEDHIDFLRILGVENIFLMFDNEEAKEGKDLGAGNQAMDYMSRIWSEKTGLNFRSAMCPGNDPAASLENYRHALQLRNYLRNLFPTGIDVQSLHQPE